MYSAKDRGKKKINRHKSHRSKIFTRRKSCCVWWDCKGIMYYELLPRKFWEDGIFKLPERWRKVVEKNGEYIIK